jgi:hypothetical protein
MRAADKREVAGPAVGVVGCLMATGGQMRPGERVGGRFVLEAFAGAGAMGTVYMARDIATGERVAVKILLGGEQGAARFDREVAVIARLHHPRIVRYVAHGTTPEGRPFLAMEWLEGETLHLRMARALPTSVEAIDIARSIAEALVAAHAIGVVHRDLKPANVVLVRGASDALKVLDFGIAKITSDGPALTGSGDIVGTPAYMSPEQALARKDIDGRSDIFSLGCILYHCLSGSLPFVADGPLRVLLRLTSERAAPLASVTPGIPARLAALVDAMLAPLPAERPGSAALVHAALSSLRVELAPTASRMLPTVSASTPPPLATRHNTATQFRAVSFVLLALGALSLGGLAAAWLLLLGPLSHPRITAAGEGSCPTKALGCTTLSLRDATHADPLEVAAVAQAVGGTFGGGGATMVVTDQLVKDGVDLSRDAVITVHLAHGVRVEVSGRQLVAFREPASSRKPIAMPDPGGCAVGQAYAAASALGLRTQSPWRMTFWDEGDGPGYLFVAPDDESWTKLMFIRAEDCTRGVITIPP